MEACRRGERLASRRGDFTSFFTAPGGLDGFNAAEVSRSRRKQRPFSPTSSLGCTTQRPPGMVAIQRSAAVCFQTGRESSLYCSATAEAEVAQLTYQVVEAERDKERRRAAIEQREEKPPAWDAALERQKLRVSEQEMRLREQETRLELAQLVDGATSTVTAPCTATINTT